MEYTVLKEARPDPAGEYNFPSEQVSLPTSEYYGQKELKQKEGKGIKKSLFKSIAAVMSVITVVSASFGIDLLGGAKDVPYVPDAVVFPVLGNLDPDFEGKYAWSDYGSEEYLRVVKPGEDQYTYLVMGGAWESFGNSLGTADGASYDRKTNTLTLDHCKLDFIDANLMGNGFTIKVIGDCYIGGIQLWGAYYGGSLTLTGPGKLYVAEEMTFEGEFSQTCLMVDAELEVLGQITIGATSMQQAIYYSPSLTLKGGKGAVVTEFKGEDGKDYYNYTVLDDSGNLASGISFTR